MALPRNVEGWRQMLMALHSETVVRWPWEGFRWCWTRKSRCVGRRGIDRELLHLIREMQVANLSWGAL